MKFGERLRALREDNDEKQKDIADLIFVSNKVISDYERGLHFPRDERVIIMLAQHFNVSIDYLFGLTDIKNAAESNVFIFKYYSLPPETRCAAEDFVDFLYKKYVEPQNDPQN